MRTVAVSLFLLPTCKSTSAPITAQPNYSKVTASPGNNVKPKVSSEPAGKAPAINRLFAETGTHLHSHRCPGWDLNSSPWLLPPSHTTMLLPSSLGAPHDPRHPVQSRASTPPKLGGGFGLYMYFTAEVELSIKHSGFLSLSFFTLF